MATTEPLNLQERLHRAMSSAKFGKLARLALKLLTVEIAEEARIGKGLRLPHGAAGLVIHPQTSIGANVKIFQGVTIGRADQWVPGGQGKIGGVRIGKDVIIGAGAKILFSSGRNVEIGQGAVIGANSVVTRDVPAYEIWAGAPARKIRDRPDKPEMLTTAYAPGFPIQYLDGQIVCPDCRHAGAVKANGKGGYVCAEESFDYGASAGWGKPECACPSQFHKHQAEVTA